VAALTLCTAAHAAQVSVHDPVMAKEGNKYYLFSTGPGITFYSSSDMLSWRPEGRVFAGEPAWAKKAAPTFNDHIWAPDIQYHNGRYLLYYSVSGFGKNTSGIGVTSNATLDPRSPTTAGKTRAWCCSRSRAATCGMRSIPTWSRTTRAPAG
jgi:arabinan endo-1,5-alpha-L-arabinosidase